MGNLLSESGASGSDVYAGYVIPIDETGGLNTGVGIFNPSPMALALTFTLFDTNGVMIEKTTATLAAGGHTARLAAGDLFPDVSGLQGTLIVTASAPVAAMGIRQNPTANIYTLLTNMPFDYYTANADGTHVVFAGREPDVDQCDGHTRAGQPGAGRDGIAWPGFLSPPPRLRLGLFSPPLRLLSLAVNSVPVSRAWSSLHL